MNNLETKTINNSTQQLDELIFKSLMSKAGTSFFWASTFLPANCRQDIADLYTWFRLVDDLVDEYPELGQIWLPKIKTWILSDWADFPSEIVLWQRVAEIARKYSIPNKLFLDFLAAQIQDLHQEWPKTESDLSLYCYGVAGVVGEMVAIILGVNNSSAYSAARDLGEAMQLTNILRDLTADHAVGKQYLPLSITNNPQAIRSIAERAEKLYDTGIQGVLQLHRGQFAILYAANLYRKILSKVETVLEQKNYPRTFTRADEKIIILSQTAYKHLWRRTWARMNFLTK